jgi:tetratricopeptide (TPR) repeat protein
MGASPRLCFVLAVVFLPGAQSADEIEQRAFTALRELRYREALSAFERALSLDPERASAHYGRGVVLSRLVNYGAAVASLERAVSLDRELAPAWRQMAILYAQLGQRQSARGAYHRARSLAEVPAGDRLALARALRKAELLEEAREVLHAAPHAPLSAEEYLELGLVEKDRGDCQRAAEHFVRATADAENSRGNAYYEYARCLELLGETERAIEYYRRAVEKDPTHPSSRFRLGNLLLRTAQEEEGRALLRGYEKFRQWDRQTKLLLAMISSGTLPPDEHKRKMLSVIDLLLVGGSLQAAERLIQSGLATYPEEPRFRVAHAKWLMASGEFDQAAETLVPVLSLPSPPFGAFWVSGRIHLRQGRLDEALKDYRSAFERSNDTPAPLLKELATVYAMNNRLDEAQVYFQKAIEKNPSFGAAHADLGLLLETKGEREKAEGYYRRALEIDPELIAAQQGLASLLLEKGEIETAEELFRQSVELNPNDPVLRYNLALALERLGRTVEASAERERARQLEPRRR